MGGNYMHRSKGRNPNPITYTTKTLVCQMYDEGYAPEEIADILDRDPEQISNLIHKLKQAGQYEYYVKLKYAGEYYETHISQYYDLKRVVKAINNEKEW